MTHRARQTVLSAKFGAIASSGAWHQPDLLATRLAAFVASEAEMRAILGELGACPYRGGFLGAGAPVLPSPDELSYVAKILGRVSACVEHALEGVRPDEAVGVCA